MELAETRLAKMEDPISDDEANSYYDRERSETPIRR